MDALTAVRSVRRYLREPTRYGTLLITLEDGAPVLRIGNLWAVATPFTRPETMRVEFVPGSGEVIGFELEGDRVVRARYDDDVFERTE